LLLVNLQPKSNSTRDSVGLYLIVLSVIVYVLRPNCRAAGWRWDTITKRYSRGVEHFKVKIFLINNEEIIQPDQNSLASEMRTRGNERVSVRQGYGYGCRYGTLNEANLLKTARSLEA
jgi:hypothetical protein